MSLRLARCCRPTMPPVSGTRLPGGPARRSYGSWGCRSWRRRCKPAGIRDASTSRAPDGEGVQVAKIVSVAHMRRIEQAANAGGWSYDEMMLRAGRAVAEVVLARVPGAEGKKVVILVGPGNNGGDGLVAGARLAERGMSVTAYLLRPRRSPDPHAATLQDLGGQIFHLGEGEGDGDLERVAGSSDVLIDAVLGTGFGLP